MKTCSHCGETKNVADFSRTNAARPSGWCRSCVQEYNASYRSANRERLSAQDQAKYARNLVANRRKRRDYYARHRDRLIAASDRNRRANMDRARRQRREYARRFPEKHRESQRRYRATHKDARLAAKHMRRARLIAAPGRGVTAAEWREVRSLGLCAYCNERKPLTMDHVDALVRGGAHDVENVVAACKSCNFSKQDRPLVLWLAQRRAA